VRELFTVYGSASPSAAGSGSFTGLTATIGYDTFDYIVVPKGLKAKIWAKRLSGTVGYQLRILWGPPGSQVVVSQENLAGAGELALEKRRPLVLIGDGSTALSFAYSAAGAGTVSFEVEVELTDEE
jgi:hypothetical protein